MIVGGQPGPIVEAYDTHYLPVAPTFSFDTRKVERLTGLSIPLPEISALLHGLGITISEAVDTCLQVTIPSHRFDLQQEVDLVEEVVRLYGYDNITAQSIQTVMQAGTVCANEQKRAQLAAWFRSRGYHETISYSFVDPELQAALYPEQKAMELLNPISSELSHMRVGLWPGLLASMVYNLHRQQQTIQLFEMGVIFRLNDNQLSENSCIAGLITGEKGGLSWNEPTRCFDFFDLKGDVSALLAQLKLKQVSFVPGLHDALHPGQAAQIIIDDKPAGWIGALHPRLHDALELRMRFLFLNSI